MYVCLTFEVLYSCSGYLKNFGMSFETRLKLDHSAIRSPGSSWTLGPWSWVSSYLDFWPLATAVGPKGLKEGHNRGWVIWGSLVRGGGEGPTV